MPTLKYKDPVTGEYKSDIHVVGAVSSVNGKTGVVEIDDSDVTEALGYTPADASTTQEKLIAGSGVTIADDGKTISAAGGVNDVKVGSTSVLSDGVALIKLFSGLSYNANGLYVGNPSNDNIDSRATNIAVTTRTAPYAVKSALTTTKSVDPVWTAEEQAAARERIGAGVANLSNAVTYDPTILENCTIQITSVVTVGNLALVTLQFIANSTITGSYGFTVATLPFIAANRAWANFETKFFIDGNDNKIMLNGSTLNAGNYILQFVLAIK